MYSRVELIARDVQKVISHDVAPTNFILKILELRERTPLATVVFIIVVFTIVLLAPFFKNLKISGIRKDDLEKRLFLN